MTGSFTAACVQMRSGLDVDANVADMRDGVRDAAGRGATYVQTPEMTGIVQRSRRDLFARISADENHPVFAAASELARELRIWLHVGSTAVAVEAERAANRAALFNPNGERVATYDKIHMFDVDLDEGERWRESAVYRPGSDCVIVEGPAPMGLAICYDLRFPALYRTQAKYGALLLTAPSCFTRQTGKAHWHVLTRARAIENGAFLVAAAQGGDHEDGRETYGHSVIIGPWGEVLADSGGEEPGVIVAEIDVEQARKARAKVPVLSNERAFSEPDGNVGEAAK